MTTYPRTPSKLQTGSTLLVAVVILLLASLMALMAMNVGVFEQRSVKISWQSTAQAVVASGLEVGERVVSQNMLLLARQFRIMTEAQEDKAVAAPAHAASTAKGSSTGAAK